MKMSRRAFVGAAAMAALARPAVVAAEPLIFGCVPANSVHWIACAAVEQGFFKNVGFDAEIDAIQSSPQSMQILITGQSNLQHAARIGHRGDRAGRQHAGRNRGTDEPRRLGSGWCERDQGLADLKGRTIGVLSLRVSEVWLSAQL